MKQSRWLSLEDTSVYAEAVAWTDNSAFTDEENAGSLVLREATSTYRYDPFRREWFSELFDAVHRSLPPEDVFSAALATWTFATSADSKRHDDAEQVREALRRLPLASSGVSQPTRLFEAATRVYGVQRDVQRLHGQVAGSAVDFWDSQRKRSGFAASVAFVLSNVHGWEQRRAQAYSGHAYDADQAVVKSVYEAVDERFTDELLAFVTRMAGGFPVVQRTAGD